MTDVTSSENRDIAGLSAADEQLLKELTERARAGLGEEAQAGPFGELGEHVAGLDAEQGGEVASGPVRLERETRSQGCWTEGLAIAATSTVLLLAAASRFGRREV